MPTSTNLGLVTPASTDYVTAGATAMTTLANGIDGYFGAATTYTPTLTNVTGGTVSGRFYKIGKLGFVHVFFSAGTATGIGNVTASLPAGWTTLAVGVQTLGATGTAAGGLTFAYASSTTITITATAAGATFAAAASVAGIRVTGWVMLA